MKTKQLQSDAAASYHALQGTIETIRGLQRELSNDIIALEQTGAKPVPPTLSDEYLRPDTKLINGSAYEALPSPSDDANIQLFQKRRRADQLKITMAAAEKQIFAASMDLSRELLAEHEPEIRALHRERALVLLKLFRVNRDLETVREKILKAGGVVAHALDGWSLRFFGTSFPPTPLNTWPLKYLAECARLGIITTDKDIEDA